MVPAPVMITRTDLNGYDENNYSNNFKVNYFAQINGFQEKRVMLFLNQPLLKFIEYQKYM